MRHIENFMLYGDKFLNSSPLAQTTPDPSDSVDQTTPNPSYSGWELPTINFPS